MKNVLIFGSSRAGKTTLARRICQELGYNIAGTNLYVSALIQAYPQLGIKRFSEIKSTEDYMNSINAVTPFLAHSLCSLARNSYALNEMNFVSDTEHFNIDVLMPLLDELLLPAKLKKEDIFFFVGLVNAVTREELFSNIKKYDTDHDWTKNSTDDELHQFCELHHKDAEGMKWLRESFERHNFNIYDTSGDRQKIFSNIVQDIEIANRRQDYELHH